ncbi:MAG: hypothetical protein ACFB2X_02745 [Rivularia sp. (in: cyanobacteria)]
MHDVIVNIFDSVSTIDLLTEEECLKIRSVVDNLQEYWVQRAPDLPFYSLGAASYLDAVEDNAIYYQKVKLYNPILSDNFDWLYQKLAQKLSSILDDPVIFQETLALPGFHIFKAHKAFEQPMASTHRDLQYKLLNWEEPEKIDFNNTLSLTLAIALPHDGGGLLTWDLHHDNMQTITNEQINSIIAQGAKHYHPYEIGKFVLHSGHEVHQIAPGQNLQPLDERITLQGHCLRTQDSWWFYW